MRTRPPTSRTALAGRASRFKASVGLDDEVPGTNGVGDLQGLRRPDDGLRLRRHERCEPDRRPSTYPSPVRVRFDSSSSRAPAPTDDHADWAAARVECGSTETTPPTVTGRTPSPGATGCASQCLADGDVLRGDGSSIAHVVDVHAPETGRAGACLRLPSRTRPRSRHSPGRRSRPGASIRDHQGRPMGREISRECRAAE